MRITVLGTGYVGLVTGTCFSDSGNHVTCVDVDPQKLKSLAEGQIPFYEPGLDEMVARNVCGGRLRFTQNAEEAVAQSQVVFLAVGTPQGEDGASNLKHVWEALEGIQGSLSKDTLLVMKSTVPVGTADKIRQKLASLRYPVQVVSNPEFLKEGAAISDFLRPERVIIGTDSPVAREIMADLYAPFVRNGSPVLFMSNRSAELTKYAANTFLAMKISFINEIAFLAEQVGADIHEVRAGIVTDSRIGKKFLYPGCGYGGSCFPKDVRALIHLGRECEVPLTLFEQVDQINERQKRLLFLKISKHFKGKLNDKKIAVWGLSFKPETDDMREAPSVTLIEQLLESHAKVHVFDPIAKDAAKKIFGSRIEYAPTAYDALKGANALAILTEWNEFRSPDFDLVLSQMKEPVLFDGRDLYNPHSLKKMGFSYYCIGRPDPT